jgi:hypothetical protein
MCAAGKSNRAAEQKSIEQLRRSAPTLNGANNAMTITYHPTSGTLGPIAEMDLGHCDTMRRDLSARSQ